MNIKNVLQQLGTEIDEEKESKLSDADRKLHAVAQRLLLLERDLKVPGAARSTEERVDRILEAIAKESF